MCPSSREDAVPRTGVAWCLGRGAVSGRLPEQQLLSLQPQVLATAVGTQRGVCGHSAEAPEVQSGPGPGTGGPRSCPSQPPRQGLPGRGPAHLEGNSAYWLCDHTATQSHLLPLSCHQAQTSLVPHRAHPGPRPLPSSVMPRMSPASRGWGQQEGCPRAPAVRLVPGPHGWNRSGRGACMIVRSHPTSLSQSRLCHMEPGLTSGRHSEACTR